MLAFRTLFQEIIMGVCMLAAVAAAASAARQSCLHEISKKSGVRRKRLSALGALGLSGVSGLCDSR
jgi:hypothetical protein